VERRALGKSDLAITPVGVGTAPIGSVPGTWWVNWGPQDENDAVRAIHAALDAGINWIDTAPFYGWGRAEEIVGRAIRGRDDVLVFTKCGTMRHADGGDYMSLRPEAIRADVEDSLRRLGVERIDLLQIHDRDPAVPIEETWGAVMELVAEGTVRHGGISNHPVDEIERALAIGPVAALQHDLGVIVWAPLASGFLTDGFSVDLLHEDDFRRTHAYAQLELESVRAALRGDRRTAAQGAIAFVLSHPAVTGAIVGVRNEREASELAPAADLRLTPTEVARVCEAS
jgi:aryl-alcohol dehydrogenase-like predicted oxidoreductase